MRNVIEHKKTAPDATNIEDGTTSPSTKQGVTFSISDTKQNCKPHDLVFPITPVALAQYQEATAGEAVDGWWTEFFTTLVVPMVNMAYEAGRKGCPNTAELYTPEGLEEEAIKVLQAVNRWVWFAYRKGESEASTLTYIKANQEGDI